MAKSLSAMFNIDALDIKAFAGFAEYFGDDLSPVDVAGALEKIRPVFNQLEEATRPRVVSARGGRNQFLVLPLSYDSGSRMGYRIIERGMRKDGKWLDALDIRRLPGLDELLKRGTADARLRQGRWNPHSIEDRFDLLLNRDLGSIRRRRPLICERNDDISFLHDPQSYPIDRLEPLFHETVEKMLEALGGIIGPNRRLRGMLEKYLSQDIRRFVHGRIAKSLADARTSVNADALDLLAQNPSAQTLAGYRWLTLAPGEEAEKNRWNFARRYPIALAGHVFGSASPLRQLDEKPNADPDAAAAAYFHTDDAKILQFYRTLREAHTGTQIAQNLPWLSRFIARVDQNALPLDCPENWDMLQTMAAAAGNTAQLLNKQPADVFADMTGDLADADEWRDTIERHFTQRRHSWRGGGKFESIVEAERLIERHVLSLFAPKFLTQARGRGLDIPVDHAIYLLAGGGILGRSFNPHNQLPRRLRESVHKNGTPLHMLLSGIKPHELFDKAFHFATNRGELDARLRSLFIMNRFFEHGERYRVEPLPEMAFNDEGLAVVPLTSQSDFLKDSYRNDHEFWREGFKTITDKFHFVSIRQNGGVSLATAIVSEPETEDGEWQIERYHAGRNFRYEDWLRENYLRSAEFLARVDLPAYARKREQLYNALWNAARPDERIGHNEKDSTENATVAREMHDYILIPGWTLDVNGCISTPKSDAIISTLLTQVAPYYAGANARRLSGRPRPDMG